jgi:hypothetical protein
MMPKSTLNLNMSVFKERCRSDLICKVQVLFYDDRIKDITSLSEDLLLLETWWCCAKKPIKLIRFTDSEWRIRNN